MIRSITALQTYPLRHQVLWPHKSIYERFGMKQEDPIFYKEKIAYIKMLRKID